MNEEYRVIFRETQRFGRKIRVLSIIAGCFFLAAAVYEINLLSQGKQPLHMIWLVLFLAALGFGVPMLLNAAILTTEVRSNGLFVQLCPFHGSFQRIPVEKLKSLELRTYRPILEYGGWGLRYGFSGKAYHMRGNWGVQCVFSNNKKLLIGSQKADELYQAINFIIHKGMVSD